MGPQSPEISGSLKDLSVAAYFFPLWLVESALWDTPKENNINIPFPRRDVQILSDTAFATLTAIDT